MVGTCQDLEKPYLRLTTVSLFFIVFVKCRPRLLEKKHFYKCLVSGYNYYFNLKEVYAVVCLCTKLC